MAGKKEYEEKTRKLLEPVAEENGVRIYDVEYVKEGKDYYLRCFIDKDGGVNIQDCENVSRALSAKLDENDFISDAYILEVSSPGLGRQLKKDSHLEYSIGEDVDIKLYEALDGVKEFTGRLKSFDKDVITIEVDDGEKNISRKSIASVYQHVEF
ncbi:MAG: ribosome maturation factor RimP [Lachnospiraceae bacterium]|nr:ribosome maturation factor RimP [Lachnospiraceae bacterium]